jgi:DNA-directed RNA polymerase omega subunit
MTFMKHYVLEDFPEVDSLYRLVNIASRRANQINKSETRPLIVSTSKKPTIIALEEVRAGKVGYRTSESGESGENDYDVE